VSPVLSPVSSSVKASWAAEGQGVAPLVDLDIDLGRGATARGPAWRVPPRSSAGETQRQCVTQMGAGRHLDARAMAGAPSSVAQESRNQGLERIGRCRPRSVRVESPRPTRIHPMPAARFTRAVALWPGMASDGGESRAGRFRCSASHPLPAVGQHHRQGGAELAVAKLLLKPMGSSRERHRRSRGRSPAPEGQPSRTHWALSGPMQRKGLRPRLRSLGNPTSRDTL